MLVNSFRTNEFEIGSVFGEERDDPAVSALQRAIKNLPNGV
jgi:hypothetical protein